MSSLRIPARGRTRRQPTTGLLSQRDPIVGVCPEHGPVGPENAIDDEPA